MTAQYEAFAVRYATREVHRHEHFIDGDPHAAIAATGQVSGPLMKHMMPK